MKIDIVNLNKFIKVNNLQEVTNPITFENGSYPTSDGLLSYEIFGVAGSYDRKTLFAYIDLKKHFLHPLMYINLKQMDAKIGRVIEGSAYYSINEKGKLVEDPENGHTGIGWLYKNFEKLSYVRNNSVRRGRKIDLLENMTKDEIFCDKWLVIPAYYRDVNLTNVKNGKIGKNVINDLYKKLINLSQSMDSEFELMGIMTENNIQKCLVDIYQQLTSELKSKKGLIKKDLLGK